MELPAEADNLRSSLNIPLCMLQISTHKFHTLFTGACPPPPHHYFRRNPTIAAVNSAMESHESSQTFHWRYAEFDDSNFQIRGRTFFFFLVILSLIIFISIIYLYARWLCNLRPESIITATTSLQSPPILPPQQGLDLSRISKIPILLHQTSSGGSEVECSICLGIFQDGEKVKVLPDCRHCYHSDCVDKWLNNQSTCPLCRSSLRLHVESLV